MTATPADRTPKAEIRDPAVTRPIPGPSLLSELDTRRQSTGQAPAWPVPGQGPYTDTDIVLATAARHGHRLPPGVAKVIADAVALNGAQRVQVDYQAWADGNGEPLTPDARHFLTNVAARQLNIAVADQGLGAVQQETTTSAPASPDDEMQALQGRPHLRVWTRAVLARPLRPAATPRHP